jgi:hypothetical protein
VLGLDLLKESTWVRGRPFLQTFAYAQVLQGGTVNFSFADNAPVPVSYRLMRPKSWTHALLWDGEEARPADALAFDYLLVGGEAPRHEALPGRFPVEAVTHEGRWRLYRVVHGPR